MAERKFKIKNPYESVTALLGKKENHYKTNLHTHSTVSDASVNFNDMVREYYKHGFDILAMTEHGIIGKKWDEKPTEIPLYYHQYILGRSKTPLTAEEMKEIEEGTRPAPDFAGRVPGRGMHCLTGGIELNMVTLTKSHVNGFFCDFGTNNWGFENGYLYAVRKVHEHGGISFINHPGDWLHAHKNVANAHDIKNIRRFGDIFIKYPSCVGTEICNRVCGDSKNDRIFWDELIRYVVPHGCRNVFGFANSDAHALSDVNTSFEDFILPAFSQENMRTAMENGTFFAVSRYARNELGEDFKANDLPFPRCLDIKVDEKKGTITVKCENTDKIEWIADGRVLKADTKKAKNGTVSSKLTLADFENDISCYVRFQMTGEGGASFSQPFILDDGNLDRFIIPDTRTDKEKIKERVVFNLKSMRVPVLVKVLTK